MRKITVKYEGQCEKCVATLAIGTEAVYERGIGIFCLACEPTDPEEIRAYRQKAADKKADKYQGWADARREKAAATLKHTDRFTGDIAFNTQPGHIPFRARIIKQEDKAFENLSIARTFERKAQSLRHVRVAGDAERKRQKQRDYIKARLHIGMVVDTGMWGVGTILKINNKTATVTGKNFKANVDLAGIYIPKTEA